MHLFSFIYYLLLFMIYTLIYEIILESNENMLHDNHFQKECAEKQYYYTKRSKVVSLNSFYEINAAI